MPRFKEDGSYTFVCNLCENTHQSFDAVSPKEWAKLDWDYYVCPSCQEKEEEEEMKETWKPNFDGLEPETFRPSHYHDAPCDVMELQGYVITNCANMLDPGPEERCKIDVNKRLWCIGAIVKHMCRLGKKDDLSTELRKIENYAHYARTGHWLIDD